MLETILIVIVLITLSYVAYKLGALKKSGAIAAVLVGAAIFIGTGVKGLFILGTFFVTSTFWSKFKQDGKRASSDVGEKDGARDYIQVLANGGVPSLASILYYLDDNPIWLIAFVMAIAAANADTWASEIGVLSKREPINLFTWKRVATGTSGAISLLGTLSAFVGSALIGIIARILWSQQLTPPLVIAAVIFGFLSMLLDTILGMTLQRKNKCLVCGKITEKKIHCGKEATHYSGITLINNDAVNILSILLMTMLGTLILY